MPKHRWIGPAPTRHYAELQRRFIIALMLLGIVISILLLAMAPL